MAVAEGTSLTERYEVGRSAEVDVSPGVFQA